tara:strand:+ start:977 stop:1321 length:345 start_codon:yes stop_codon:yes gene_type:complete
MFKVEIKDIKIKTKIGVPRIERKKEQTLIVSLYFYYNVSLKKNLDDIKFLKDYSIIIKFLKKFISKSEYKTLEKLIVEAKKTLCKKFNLKSVNLKIEKPNIAKKYNCGSISVSK